MENYRILCYGDSNTWGWNPIVKARYQEEQRWTGVLQSILGTHYRVIEEGLNGRTTVWDDPIEGYKSGKEYLIPCLETHKPLDLVIIMLGTNDCKKRFSLSAYDIAKGIETIVKIIKKSETGRDDGTPKILILAPPPVAQLTEYAEMFENAEEKSRLLGSHYREIASAHECEFFDTSTVVQSSNVDGIHLEATAHTALGKAVAEIVKKILT